MNTLAKILCPEKGSVYFIASRNTVGFQPVAKSSSDMIAINCLSSSQISKYYQIANAGGGKENIVFYRGPCLLGVKKKSKERDEYSP